MDDTANFRPSGKSPSPSDRRREAVVPGSHEHALVTQALIGFLDHASFGVVVFTSGLRVVYANRTGITFLRSRKSLTEKKGILVVGHEGLSAILTPGPKKSEVCACDTTLIEEEGLPENRRQFLVTCLRLRRDGDAGVILLQEPNNVTAASAAGLREAYRLTASEAELVQHLVQGLSLNECALRLKISIHTARTHLKKIFAKCNVRSQAALIRQLLSGPIGLLKGL